MPNSPSQKSANMACLLPSRDRQGAVRSSAKSLFILLLVAAPAAAAPNFSSTVQPFLTKNCTLCHNAQAKVGGLDLTAYHSEAEALKDREVWEKVLSRVKGKEMPPKGRPPLTPAELAKFTGYLDGAFAKAD